MIIRHDRSDRQSLVDPTQWPAITSFFRGSGGATLIAPTWLLTAAHVARDIPTEHRLTVELAEKRYGIARVFIHPAYGPLWENNSEQDVVDLALVELEAPVEDVQLYELYTGDDEQGQEILVLGNGLKGEQGSPRDQYRR